MSASLDKKSTMASFNRAAGSYDAHDFLQREVGSRVLQQLEMLVVDPQRIADLGAGTGRFSRLLGRKFKKSKIYLIDFAIKMLSKARHNKRIKLFSRERYICGDIEALPIADGQIDLAFTSLALQWSQQLELSIAEIRRILSPGGLFLFATLGPDTLHELRSSFDSISSTSHVNEFLDMHEVGDILSAQGFSDPVLTTERIIVEYEDVMKLMRDLKGIGASNVSGGGQKTLMGKERLAGMIKAYDAFRCDSKIPATYEVIIGHAWALDRTQQNGNAEHTFPLSRLKKR
ncbi:MAG: malonyl-[acyl-carrier protein] O-methyltransferase BioC [Thiotrichales bacterium]|nr:malonyl-[acyl-carrier protein] O-methyltransferase BioC [Thiotrichales bacterium]